MQTRKYALDLARRGLPVFRLARGSKNKFIDTDWATSATADLFDVYDKFGDGAPNIGVRTNGLVVLDVDAHKGGLDSLKNLGELPGTFTVRTPRGGLHIYFKAPAGSAYANSVEKLGAGLDVRAHNGYVVGPGSESADGTYKIEVDAPIAALPASLARTLQIAAERPTEPQKARGELDTPAALESAAAWLQSAAAPIAIEGSGGNATTYGVACSVMDRGVSPEMCLELMATEWNERCAPPWELDDLEKIIGNAAQYRQAPIGRDNPADGMEPIPAMPAENPFRARLWEYSDTWETIEAIPQIPWVVKNLMIRRTFTLLGAPGATGKSSWALQLAVAIATGRGELIAHDVVEPTNVIVINNEDSLDVMRARLGAMCRHFGVDPSTIERKVKLFSGAEYMFKLARAGGKGRAVPGELLAGLERVIQEDNIGVVIFDPFAGLHEANENDNSEMQRVIDILKQFSGRTNTANNLVHHTAKPSVSASEGYAGNVNSIRGASAIKDASRTALTAYMMSEKDAKNYGVRPEIRHTYVRFDYAKANHFLASPEPQWFKKISVAVGKQSMGVLQPCNVPYSPADAAEPETEDLEEPRRRARMPAK